MKRHSAAFSRHELLAVIFIAAVLALVAGTFIIRSQYSKEYQCAANLKALGSAVSLYAADNHDRLPYAFVEGVRVWDGLIFPFVPPGPNGLMQKHLLRCPADTVTNKNTDLRRRTYAMPSHAMGEAYWPLGPENNTGVGLWWRNSMAQWDFLTNFVSLTKTQGADTNTELTTVKMPAITRDMIHAPATTLLLTEHAIPQNTAFAASGSTIAGPTDHLDKNAMPADRYHGGKIEYLMVDGHVELLFPLESTGQRDPRDASDKLHPNLWTIRPED